jgi:hypothetical protein
MSNVVPISKRKIALGRRFGPPSSPRSFQTVVDGSPHCARPPTCAGFDWIGACHGRSFCALDKHLAVDRCSGTFPAGARARRCASECGSAPKRDPTSDRPQLVEISKEIVVRLPLRLACGLSSGGRNAGIRSGPDPTEMATRYGAETSVLDWRERLVCSRCKSRDVDMVVSRGK